MGVTLDQDLQSGLEQACRQERVGSTTFLPPSSSDCSVIRAMFIIEQIRRNR